MGYAAPLNLLIILLSADPRATHSVGWEKVDILCSDPSFVRLFVHLTPTGSPLHTELWAE